MVTFFGIDLSIFLVTFVAQVAIFLAVNLSLNLEMGFTGVVNFGKSLFVSAGAAIAGTFAVRFAALFLGYPNPMGAIENLDVIYAMNNALSNNIALSAGFLIVCIVVAAVVGAAFGFVVDYPVRKLRGDYLAIFLFIASVFFVVILSSYTPIIEGNLGILLPDPFGWAGSNRNVVATAVLLGFAALVFLYVERLTASPLGRMLKAIRDNETAAEALGKDVASVRRQMLILASSISAMAGALYAFYTANVNPGTYTFATWTALPFLMVLLGGAGNNRGVLAGTMAYWLLYDIINVLQPQLAGLLPFDIVWAQYILTGSLLLVIIYLRPGGIIPEVITRNKTPGREQTSKP